ncbi:hypothetical protein GCM10009864_78340 [Streptomyces lunalinharesii]|uniref:Uncharacterized protein n=1 Tax=Streptomyces lunalinharesii TaxID=333384 RepID=A0ABN3T3L2_9ACTN
MRTAQAQNAAPPCPAGRPRVPIPQPPPPAPQGDRLQPFRPALIARRVAAPDGSRGPGGQKGAAGAHGATQSLRDLWDADQASLQPLAETGWTNFLGYRPIRAHDSSESRA